MRSALILAYHFPPLAGSSGIQRTLRFVQHLPRFGWRPLVLTVSPQAYERTEDSLLAEIPPDTVVQRSFALDTKRHLSIAGRYPLALARPDRWISWRLRGVADGMRMIREHRPEVIWSTYPIATAHVIAAELHRKSGLPWIADFRDPMAFDDWPEDADTRRSYHQVEATAMRLASRALVTTPGAARRYQARYPAAADRVMVLENGYDEDAFLRATATAPARTPDRRFILLHSGIVYPSERDPSQLFEALGHLLRSGHLTPDKFVLRFRAAVHDDLLRTLAGTYGATPLIEFQPPVPYQAALQEMLSVDGLLVLQAAECNDQIPAKLYEYLRAGRPVLALTDGAGDTAALVRRAAAGQVAPLDDAQALTQALPGFVTTATAGGLAAPKQDVVAAASRLSRTRALAECFVDVCKSRVLKTG